MGREHGRFPELMTQLRELLIDESLEFNSEDFSRDMAAGVLHGKDPQALASVVLSALVGYHLSSTFFGNKPGNIDSDRFVETLVDLMIKE